MIIASQKIPIWDTITHTLSGFIFVIIFSLLIYKFKNKIKITPIFCILTAFSFSMTSAVIWEMLEFSYEYFTYSDTQKDRVITSFNSDYLNTKASKKTKIIKNIDHTILYDKENRKLVTIKKGYLDIGLIDTMKDLIVYFIGTIVSCTIVYIFLKYKQT